MLELPLINTPNQEFNAVLDDQNCTIQLRFLDNIPYFSLWVDDELIVQNVICLPRQKILLYDNINFNGNFFIVDLTSPADQQSKAYYEQLENRFKLIYVTESEITEIENDSN